MIVGIHQPNFLPWLGYFDKIIRSDIFIFLDDVQYPKGSVANRNKIKTRTGADAWVTVPLAKSSKSGFPLYTEIFPDENKDWRGKLLNAITENYRKAPFYNEVFSYMDDLIQPKELSLAALNMRMILSLAQKLSINTEFRRSSEIQTGGNSNERLIQICKSVNGSTYLSGQGAKKYMDIDAFKDHGIQVVYQDYQHPVYKQINGEFIPRMSILDTLLNIGFEQTSDLLKVKTAA